jgi:hypothetical protein
MRRQTRTQWIGYAHGRMCKISLIKVDPCYRDAVRSGIIFAAVAADTLSRREP